MISCRPEYQQFENTNIYKYDLELIIDYSNENDNTYFRNVNAQET